jgi:type I restriction enzyme S subunit
MTASENSRHGTRAASGSVVRGREELKDSGLPWAPKIPSHWAVKRVKDIADLRSGDQITSDDITPVGAYPVYGGNGLRGYTAAYTHDGTYVLIGRQGALCGNINYATGCFWASEHAVVSTLVGKNNLLWFGELLRTMNLNQHSNAAAQPGLAVDRIKRLHIPVPPRAEQEHIAAYFAAMFPTIDGTIAAKRGQLDILESLRASLIETAVTEGLSPNPQMQAVNEEWISEIPAHWEVCRIKRVVSRIDYGTSESSKPEGPFVVLKMGHIQAGEIEYRDLDFVEDIPDNLLLDTGDLLYNRTNSPDQVGKAAIFRGNKSDAITFASYLVRLRTNHRANPYFLNYLVNSNGFLSFARKLAIPSVQQSNLNSTRYGRMLIPLPPIKEQHEIREYLDAKLGELNRVVSNIETQISTLTAYRKSLIHECLTGQRRITEASLDRVKAYG